MIINSVVVGGSGGDEVEAYALGDAKNAVKDDKVNLNFSVNMATLEPSLSRGPSSFSYYPGAVSLVVGKYLYAMNTSDSNTNVIVWEKDSEGNFVNGLLTYLSGRNTSTKPIGHGVRLSYHGKIHQFTEFGNIFDVTTSGSTDALYACGSMSQDGNVIMAQYPSDLSPILLTKESGLFTKRSGLNNPNSVQGYWAFTGKKEGSKYYGYVVGKGSTGLKYVCLDVATSTIELLSTHTVQTTSENYRSPVCFKNKLICYNYGDSYKADVYTFTEEGSLTFNEEDSASLRAIVSRNSLTREVGFVQDGYLICSNDIVGYNQTKLDYKEGVGFFEVSSPFPDKEGGYVNYIGEGYASWCNLTYLPNTPGGSLIRRHVSPIEQSYVATEPITGQFYVNQTLTGFVKENNNGVLKVSTVEDPNNPPPAVPDEVGLNTVINYGGKGGINPDLVIASGVTIFGTDVSGFGSSDSNTITTPNPFSQAESIDSLEIVFATTHSSDSNYYHWLAGLVNSAYTAYDGFEIFTQGSDNLKLNVYHADGTKTPLLASTNLVSGKKTWIKLTYDKSSGYVLSFSYDGVSYNQEASSSVTKTMSVSAPIMFIGWRPLDRVGVYYWNGTIHLADCYIKVNGTEIWSGVRGSFGSVRVGYGYFRNTLTKPSDKYVSYEGGTLTEDNIQGRKATTMNIILGRSADMGSWTSDTDGYLSAQESVVLGVNKKLPTPVYLWHDLSYITPAKPETLELVVDLDANTISLSASWKNIDGVLYEYPNGFPETQASDLLDDNAVREGSNNLYATRTGGNCGLAISSTSPAGVGSSAIIGTVELDANGAIVSYSPVAD